MSSMAGELNQSTKGISGVTGKTTIFLGKNAEEGVGQSCLSIHLGNWYLGNKCRFFFCLGDYSQKPALKAEEFNMDNKTLFYKRQSNSDQML